MNNNIQKIPMHKRLLLFMNLDIIDQIVVLLKFFIPALIIGGGIQWMFQVNANIIGIILGTFVLLVFVLSLPEDNIEICSNKMQCMRFLTILVNLIIGIFCAAVTIFISSKLLNLIEKKY